LPLRDGKDQVNDGPAAAVNGRWGKAGGGNGGVSPPLVRAARAPSERVKESLPGFENSLPPKKTCLRGLDKFPVRSSREFASSPCGSCIKLHSNRLIAWRSAKNRCKIPCGQGTTLHVVSDLFTRSPGRLCRQPRSLNRPCQGASAVFNSAEQR